MNKLYCAWWNLENLFDVEDAPDRTEKLARAIGKDLAGWNNAILDLKLQQLSKVINAMNDDKGPDIIGVAEVESRNVLGMLCDRLVRDSYEIVHVDSRDERGIDVAFIYDGELLEAGEVFNHFVMRRNATRDIIQVNMKIKESGETIIFIGNHWPSRTAGVYESEPYRIMAGETLAYFHERIYENLDDETIPVLAMGDFNDNPFNRSLMEYALSTNSKEKIKKAKEKRYFYNLMSKPLASGDGSYYLQGFDILDQFLISGNVINNNSYVQVDEGSCEIFKYPEMTRDGKPVRFGKPKDKNGINEKGFSDHFPIVMEVTVQQ